MRLAKSSAILLALVFFAGCASLKSTSPPPLDQQVVQADMACRNLVAGSRVAYNNAVASIAQQINSETPGELHTQLNSVGVALDVPSVNLPLVRLYTVGQSRLPKASTAIGVPMLLEYDASHAPLYPRDGLVTSATAVYRRVNGEPHLSLLSGRDRVALHGSTYPLAVDNVAPIAEMNRRGRSVARSGFRNMIRPGSMRERSGIFLTEPYDPKKAIVLMVPGLQSTPFAFVNLLKTMRADAEISCTFSSLDILISHGRAGVVQWAAVAARVGKYGS